MSSKILIVDDIFVVRSTLSEILKAAHYTVVGEAKNGQEAIEMFHMHRPDIITMDIVMPIMNGIEATKQILKIDNEVKIIIVTAMPQESIVMEAIGAGARDYILKPFRPEDITRTIDHVSQGQRIESKLY